MKLQKHHCYRPWPHVHVLGTQSSHLFRNVHLWNQIKSNSLCTGLGLTCAIIHTLDCRLPSWDILFSPYLDTVGLYTSLLRPQPLAAWLSCPAPAFLSLWARLSFLLPSRNTELLNIYSICCSKQFMTK